MQYTKLSVVIALGGASPFPPYEVLMLPQLIADFGANFANVFTPAAVTGRQVSQPEVFALLDAHPLPAHWQTTHGPPGAGFPQWGLCYTGPAATNKGLASINCHFGIATSKGAPPPLRTLYALDLPLGAQDPPPLAQYGPDLTAWFTLYVHQNWIVRVKPSHQVDAQWGLHGEVTGVNLV